MSEPTIYRIRCTKPEVGETDEATGWHTSSCYEPMEPDYEAMAEVMLQKIDVAAWWTRDNRQLLAEQLWAAGIGGDE